MNLNRYLDKHGAASLINALGVSPAFVHQWATGHRPVPVKFCVQIERVTEGVVTRRELKPDDYWLIWPDLPPPPPRRAGRSPATARSATRTP